MDNKYFRITRMVVFGATCLFSIVVIALALWTMSIGDDTFVSSIFWIIVGSVTVMSLPVMLYLFRNVIAFEVGWIFLLWMLWVAVGGTSIGVSGLQASCSRYAPFLTGEDVQGCKLSSVITIFGFLSWIFLMLYNVLTIAMCCRGKDGDSADSEETVSDTGFTDLKIKIDFDKKVSPSTDSKKSPPPYETPIFSQETKDSLTQPGIPDPYTVDSPYPQPRPRSFYSQRQSATSSISWAEERPYPNQYHLPPYETADDSYTQARRISYTDSSPYRPPRAAIRSHYRDGRSRRTRHGSLTDTVDRSAPPVFLMPLTSDGTVVLIRPPTRY